MRRWGGRGQLPTSRQPNPVSFFSLQGLVQFARSDAGGHPANQSARSPSPTPLFFFWSRGQLAHFVHPGSHPGPATSLHQRSALSRCPLQDSQGPVPEIIDVLFLWPSLLGSTVRFCICSSARLYGRFRLEQNTDFRPAFVPSRLAVVASVAS